MPLLKREVWFADLFLCLSLTESILILQNRLSKSLFPHSQKKQNRQRGEHTGLEATLANFAIHSLAGRIYI